MIYPSSPKQDRVFATLHPALVLRQPGYMSSFLYDFMALRTEPSDHWLAIEPITDEVKIANLFDEELYYDGYWVNRWLSFDVETDSLNTHRSNLLCLAIALSDRECYVLTPDLVVKHKDMLNAICEQALPTAHNGKFDIEVLQRYGVHINLAHDTMLMHYALDENKGTHGLKYLASVYLGVPDYEARYVDKYFRTIERKDRNYAQLPTKDLYKYAAIDACVTYTLDEKLLPLVDADNVRQAYDIMIEASNALVQVESTGIKVDRPYLTQLQKKVTEDIKLAKHAIQQAAKPFVVSYIDKVALDTNWRSPDRSWIKDKSQYLTVLLKCHKELNVGSWQQMQVMLYDVLGLKHSKQLGYKTKPRSTNQEALESLLAGVPENQFITTLQTFRKLDKIRGTYIEPLLKLADDQDRVHISFNIHGTETGRLSADDSLHGIPRPTDFYGQAIRGSFIASEDHKLVIADYSQAELRIFAALSGEPFLLDAYNNDEDIHGNTTKLCFPDDKVVSLADFNKLDNDWHWQQADLDWNELTYDQAKARWKHLRTIAKNINFGGLVYLGGAGGIAAMIPGGQVKAAQLEPILKLLKSKMPIASQWQINQYRLALNQGFVQSRFGNKRRFLLITDDTKEEIRKASVNAPIQNSASQLTLLAGSELITHGWKLVHLVHDSLIFDVPATYAQMCAEDVTAVMTAMGSRYFPEVKWRADVEITDRWYQKRPTLEVTQ